MSELIDLNPKKALIDADIPAAIAAIQSELKLDNDSDQLIEADFVALNEQLNQITVMPDTLG